MAQTKPDSSQITHKLNSIGAAVVDTGTLFNMMPARPEQFYPIISGETDATDALKAAMMWSPVVELDAKTYIISDECVSDLISAHVFGKGQGQTTIEARHTSGSALRFKKQYSKLSKLSITASAERTAAGYAALCFGAHFETADVPDDPLVTRMRNCHIHDVEISGQTGAGLYMCGPTLDGSKIERVRCLNNAGHGIAIDRGFLSGRVNKSNAIGVMTIDNCLSFGNTGHALALGHKDDTTTTQTVRVVVNNFDADGRSMVQSLLYNASRKHVYWVSGSNNELNNCVATGNSTETGVFMQGSGLWARNLRQVQTAVSVEVGDNVPGLYTDGVFIDGVAVINTVSQPFAVVASNATNSKNIRVNIKYDSDIDQPIDVWSNSGTVVEDSNLVLISNADTTVNNTTTQVDVSGLRFYLVAGRKVKIRAVIYYSGDASADIRTSIGGPSGATLVRYGPAGNLKLGASDTLDVANSVSSFGSVVSFGSSASVRQAVIEGVIHNGATAGNVSVRFAQLAAVAANTTVHSGSTFEILAITE